MKSSAIDLNSSQLGQTFNGLKIRDVALTPEFKQLIQVIAKICNTPISYLSLFDSNRHWLKVKYGISINQLPDEFSFCQRTMKGRTVFEVEDAHSDPSFHNNPLVKGEPYIRFYAGAPLVTSEGVSIGTVCVLDQIPRKLELKERQSLIQLANHIIATLEQRKTK